MTDFTYRSARSGSLVVGFCIVIVIETVALHLWLRVHHAFIAWALSVTSLSAVAWLVADYRAFGRGAVRVTDGAVDLRIGRRFALELSRAEVAGVVRPTWRELPAPGTLAASDYLNLTKPAVPNVLLTLAGPASVRLTGGLRRSVKRVGLHLDAPDEFLAAMRRT